MRTHAGLIMFIGAMIVAAGAVGVIFSERDDAAADQQVPQSTAGQAQITGVSVYGISDGTADYATIEVTGGDTPRNLTRLALTLSSSGGQHTLSSRS